MLDNNEMGNLQAIKKFFGMTMEEMKTHVLRLSEEEKEELGRLSRDALKAEEIGEVVAEVTG